MDNKMLIRIYDKPNYSILATLKLKLLDDLVACLVATWTAFGFFAPIHII